jgi:hypothetical protein
VAELFADGLVGETELREAHARAAAYWKARRPDWPAAITAALASDPDLFAVPRSASDRASQFAGTLERAARALDDREAEAAWCGLIQDIFGSPLRLSPRKPTWRTPTIKGLAQVAYDERLLPEGHLAPDRLAVLADALEDAGCVEQALLDHLRSPGPHVRGCWAVGLVR